MYYNSILISSIRTLFLAGVLATEFTVDPQQQDIEPFQWVLCWEANLQSTDLIQLLVEGFFRKWFHALRQWLEVEGGADFDELYEWYLGWKNLLPDSIKADPTIKTMFALGELLSSLPF